MDVKSAVKIATSYVLDLFKDEDVSNVGLEEVEFDPAESVWVVTIGFSRPWDYPKNALASFTGETRPSRSYKVITIMDNSEQVVSIKNRAPDV
ncbi:MAG: hypothetical protein KZQ77_01875 [Candidatus Thiodiazotropha sp. (ex Notomyrtea botanica)]|nr:hypothetical protein [Candidatus Thiodiazotropha sp. (ex Notomyrtea botanica)]